MSATALTEVECVTNVERASTLLHPLRLEILERARSPLSASEIAAGMGLPRQKVNYHVRELHRADFLRKAGRRRKRNLYEQRYIATASRYLLAPELLGPVQADWRKVEDRLSAAYLLSLSARLQDDLSRVLREAEQQQKRVSTLSLDADLRFESPEQRERFALALRDALARVVAEHTSPDRQHDGTPGPGRPYRLMVGCYPVPPEATPPPLSQESAP
jgi:hypothetical protein